MADDGAGGILYSLPTICEELPAATAAGPGAGAFEILEDDWRQVELVAVGLSDVIEAELAAIRAIYAGHARGGGDGMITGFDAIHGRAEPARPLPVPVPPGRLLSLLPRPARQYEGVGFTESGQVAAGSFAVAFGPVTLYGLGSNDGIEVLGLDARPAPDAGPPADLVNGLRNVLESFDLVIVDWCRCAVTGPAAVSAYLSQ